MSWQEHASCRGTDTRLFFSWPTEKEMEREAKAICAECPVRLECLSFAVRTQTEFGTFGGLTAPERNRLLNRKRSVA